MLKLSLRSLLMHKLRLFLTVAAVTVGVAFVSGTFVLSDTMSKAFDELYDGLTKGTDVAVQAEPAYSDITTQGQLRPLDDSVVDLVRGVPGVEVAEGVADRLRAHPRQGRRAGPAGWRPDHGRQHQRRRASRGGLHDPRRPPALRPR